MPKYGFKKNVQNDSKLSTAKKATKALTLAKKAIQAPEFKWFDLDNQSAAATGFTFASPYYQILNNPAIGTGPNNRIGNSIICKSVHLRLLLQPAGSDTTTGSSVAPNTQKYRILVVYTKDILPGSTLALTDYLTATVNADPITAMKNEYLKSNYMIMFDKTVSIGDGNMVSPYSTTSVGNFNGDTKFIEKYMRCNFKSMWQAVGGPHAQGQLSLYIYQDQVSIGNTGADPAAINVYTRVKYQDA